MAPPPTRSRARGATGRAPAAVLAALAAAGALAGCGGEPASGRAPPAEVTPAAELTCADDAAAGPVRDGLTPAALAGGAGALTRALVRCALPAGARWLARGANGATACLPGQLGLAPAWAAGACDASCSETLSACLAALLDRDGRRVPIALAADPEAADGAHPLDEGRFYGDLFASPPRLFACSGRDGARAAQARRFCAAAGPGGAAACGLVPAGDCAAVCSTAGCRDPDGHLWAHPLAVRLDDRLEAASFDQGAGVVASGGALRDVDDGDWVSFRDVDFGADGSATTFTAWIATASFGNQIEAWLDGPTGRYLGTILTQRTSDAAGHPVETPQSAPINATGVSGRHSVYIHFDGPENATSWNGLGHDIGTFTHFRFR
jgi:hypothetical protein